jgi:hypothetical protein
MSDEKQFNEQRGIIPPKTGFISEEICSSCEIGLRNLISFNKDIKEKLETSETCSNNLYEYKSDYDYWWYDFSKGWSRLFRGLKEVKNFIDQGKSIEDVRIFYNEVFHK